MLCAEKFETFQGETGGILVLLARLEAYPYTQTSNLESKEKKPTTYTIYHIAGKVGGELNLADWRIWSATAKLNSTELS